MKVFLIFVCMSGVLFGEVETPPEITPEWEKKVLCVRNDVKDVVGAIEEITFGINDSIFGKEFLSRLKEQALKESTGEYVEFWPNGARKARIGYKDNKAHGHFHGWYEDGKDAFKGFYCDGVKQGVHITFFQPGTVRVSDDARIIVYDEKGRLDGLQRLFDLKGELRFIIRYREGKADGALRSWEEDPENEFAVTYVKGKLRKDIAVLMRTEWGVPYDQCVSEVVANFIKEAEKEFGVVATATGGFMPQDVQEILVSFTKYQRGTIEAARELMVRLREKLAAVINAHEKIRPYLREYPFTPERADLTVAFEKEDGSSYLEGSITFVTPGKGKFHYKIDDPNDPYKFKMVHEETYEEATKIVHGRK